MNPLMPEILEHFGLERNPFGKLAGDGEFYASPEFRRAYATVDYALSHSEMVAIVGDVGSGKSEAMVAVKEHLKARPEAPVNFIEVLHPDKGTMKIGSVLEAFIQMLEIARPGQSQQRRAWHVKFAIQERWRQGERFILIIDEAHRLSGPFLKSLKELHEQTRFGHMAALIGIVLLGHESLLSNYQKVASDVYQRLDAGHVCTMGSMTPLEIDEYIAHRVAAVNGNGLFDGEARRAVGRLASSPLGANRICAKLLATAYTRGQDAVTLEEVYAAYDRRALADLLGLSAPAIAGRAGIGRSTVHDVFDGRGKGSAAKVDAVLREAMSAAGQQEADRQSEAKEA